ncbi:MAG: histidine kinase [Gemmatimonadota bacterium]
MSLPDRLARLPLFWKLVVTQLVLLAVVGLGVAALLLAPSKASSGPLLWGVAGLVVASIGGISAWVTRVALSPLEAIEETAERVRRGDLQARAPSSPIADPRLDRVGRTLNEMLEALERSRRRQRRQSLRVLRSQERDRSRMSGDLYDGTAQTLAGVLVRLRVLARAGNEPVDPDCLALLTQQVRSALEDVRTVARRLRPPELNDLGLRSALDAQARSLEEKSGMVVQVRGDLPDARLSEDARLLLFRLVQEALDNVAQHALASRVTVTLGEVPEGVEVEVGDDGVGFDPATLPADEDPRLGLLTMIERAGYARGKIEVESAPDQGTRVRILLPLDAEPATANDAGGSRLAAALAVHLTASDPNPLQGAQHVR